MEFEGNSKCDLDGDSRSRSQYVSAVLALFRPSFLTFMAAKHTGSHIIRLIGLFYFYGSRVVNEMFKNCTKSREKNISEVDQKQWWGLLL